MTRVANDRMARVFVELLGVAADNSGHIPRFFSHAEEERVEEVFQCNRHLFLTFRISRLDGQKEHAWDAISSTIVRVARLFKANYELVLFIARDWVDR